MNKQYETDQPLDAIVEGVNKTKPSFRDQAEKSSYEAPSRGDNTRDEAKREQLIAYEQSEESGSHFKEDLATVINCRDYILAQGISIENKIIDTLAELEARFF